ncbi:hypothetical protein GGR53DRAFT_528075 [Hypoxylon sp. FL1150]|nr:hypothetical protein GGR53DRAFT_528075 [Hypoxylon sp. FL1150]
MKSVAIFVSSLTSLAAALSDTMILGMHSGEEIDALIAGNEGPGVQSSNTNGAFVMYTADGDWCNEAHLLPDDPWNFLENSAISGGDETKNFIDWCGLQLPCSGNLVMGKEGICGQGQQYNRAEGTYYSDVHDVGNGNKVVGRCVYTGTASKNCATTGSDLYEQSVRCYMDGQIC